MNIINTSELSSNQFYAAKTLIELCRLTDNTKGICFLQIHCQDTGRRDISENCMKWHRNRLRIMA